MPFSKKGGGAKAPPAPPYVPPLHTHGQPQVGSLVLNTGILFSNLATENQNAKL